MGTTANTLPAVERDSACGHTGDGTEEGRIAFGYILYNQRIAFGYISYYIHICLEGYSLWWYVLCTMYNALCSSDVSQIV